MKYEITLETSGSNYKASGETIGEALGGLGLEWHQIKAKGVVKIRQNKKELEHLFTMKHLKSIFANKLTMQLWGKRLEFLFNSK